jgi:hypothetical protein
VRWEWRTDSDDWKEYNGYQQMLLESAWRESRAKSAARQTFEVEIGGGRGADVVAMKQFILADRFRSRPIRRKVVTDEQLAKKSKR